MSNDLYNQSVPTEQSQLSGEPYPTTVMETVAGPVEVAEKSYDVQGNPVSSSGDTPIDVNALHGIEVVPSQLEVPSTGMGVEVDTTGQGSSKPVSENPEQTFLPQADDAV